MIYKYADEYASEYALPSGGGGGSGSAMFDAMSLKMVVPPFASVGLFSML